MTAVKFKGTIKADSRPYNGLESIAEQLLDKPHEQHIIVAVVETSKITEDIEGETGPTPTVKIVHVEPLDGDAAATARQLLDAAYKARTGREESAPEQLPLDGPVSERQRDEWLDKS